MKGKNGNKKQIKGIWILVAIVCLILGYWGNGQNDGTSSHITESKKEATSAISTTLDSTLPEDDRTTQCWSESDTTQEQREEVVTESTQTDQGLALGVGDLKGSEILKVHFINVGQGNATLIQCGDNNYLIDAGKEAQFDQLNHYLKEQNVTHINDFMITHFDADHMGGADLILNGYQVDQVSSNAFVETKKNTREVRELKEAMDQKGLSIHSYQYQDKIQMGKQVVATVCSPKKDYKDGNENSLVLEVVYGTKSFLLTGDITAKVEGALLEDGIGHVNVVQVAHHGSDYASGVLFAKTLSPDYAVISVGANSYGHPTKNVLNRWSKFTGKVLRTDEDGSLCFSTDGNEIVSNIE